MRMAIQYQWCDYVLGETARVPIGPYDILTGFMSGCIIARWNDRGVNYVGHVGTVNHPATDALVKRKFSAWMPPNTTGFNPFAAWLPNLPALGVKHKKSPKVMALVTTSGDFYSVAMMPDNVNATEWVCGGAKKVPAMNYAALQQAMR